MQVNLIKCSVKKFRKVGLLRWSTDFSGCSVLTFLNNFCESHFRAEVLRQGGFFSFFQKKGSRFNRKKYLLIEGSKEETEGWENSNKKGKQK